MVAQSLQESPVVPVAFMGATGGHYLHNFGISQRNSGHKLRLKFGLQSSFVMMGRGEMGDTLASCNW